MPNKMKDLRKSKGLSQEEMAAMLSIPVRTYGSYERGERPLSINVGAQIADILGVTLDELMDRDRKPSAIALDWDERAFVRLFRQLDDQQRSRVIDEMRDYAIANEAKREVANGFVEPGAVDAVRA